MTDDNTSLLRETSRQSSKLDLRAFGRSEKKIKASIFLVLFVETLERFAFHGLLCNMALLLNSKPLLWSSYNAVNTILIFYGVSYLMTLIGGWIADSILNKFRTIVIFFTIYILGYCFWPSFRYESNNSSCKNSTETFPWCAASTNHTSNSTGHSRMVPLADEACSWAIFLSLVIIGIGFGGVRANLVPFGASQIPSQDRRSLRVYFNWLYWCINIGSFLAYCLLGYVQQNVSGFYGYLVPTIALVVAFLAFSFGSILFEKRQETGSPLSEVAMVLWCACKRWCVSKGCCCCGGGVGGGGDDDGGGGGGGGGGGSGIDDDNNNIQNNHDDNAGDDDDDGLHARDDPTITNNDLNTHFISNDDDDHHLNQPYLHHHHHNHHHNRDLVIHGNHSIDAYTTVQKQSSVFRCLEVAGESRGGRCKDAHVEDTKAFLFLGILFVAIIPYWTIYYQMQTTFQIQGMHMRLDLHNHSSLNASDPDLDRNFEVPATWLSLFNIVFIIAFVPLLDRLIYPLLDRHSIMPSLRTRIFVGMVFSFFSMLCAGFVERVRLKTYWGADNAGHPFVQYIACTAYYAADMTVFWQVPQYVCIGVSEVFTSIAVMELAYTSAPKSIQSIIMGLFYFSQGLGSLVGMLVVYSFEWMWFPAFDYGNINCRTSPFSPDHDEEEKCHLDYYFFFLAGLQIINIMIFIGLSWWLKIGAGTVSKRPRRSLERSVTA